MCRWLAYSGKPVPIEQLLYRPRHSLIDQSLHSTMGAETTNGDGFGIGWYDVGTEPGVFHSIEPAWNDRNLRELSRHITSPLVFAHIRASTGSAIQQTNCHPFRYRNWLWMHNGVIADFDRVKRDLMVEVAPELYPHIEGSTDSELLFHLALTYGLEDDPPAAVQDAVGLVEEVGAKHDVEHPIQMTIATSDGTRIWAFRYSSDGRARTLFYSTAIETLELMYPDTPVMREVSTAVGREGRLVVSEPLGDELPGAWNTVPESSWGIVQPGQRDDLHAFMPTSPKRRVATRI
jgi:predicted glutamine amidotransferase